MSDFKDLFLLFICAFSNGIYFAYGFIIIYHISFIKHFHPYTIAQIYASVIGLDIGLVGSGMVFPSIVKAIGISNCFRLFSVICSCVMAIFIYCSNIWLVTIGYLLFGFCHQLISMSIIYCLNMKFKENLVKYTGYVFTGTSASCIFWGGLTSVVVNPYNKEKTKVQILDDGNIERYFDYDVS